MTEPDDPIIFAITEGELQDAALERIGRTLTDEEIYTATKGIEAGLMFDICTVYTAAIEGAIGDNS